MNYFIHIVIVFEIYLILALAMNLLAGYSGLLSFAQSAFYGISAYISAILMMKFGLHFIIVLPLTIIFNIVLSLPVIYFSIRLRNLYFALATLSWQIIVFAILYNWVSLTNGPFGIAGIPKPEIFGFTFLSLTDFAYLSSVLASAVLLFFIVFNKTHLVRLLQGLRDDQFVLMSSGKKPAYYKILAVVIATGITSISGVIFAAYYTFIDPTSFTIHESILIISIVLIGGLGSVKGSAAGALFYVLLPEALRFLNIPDQIAANLRMMIYALILILIVTYRPHGFFGKYRFE